MACTDPSKRENIIVQDMADKPSEEQVELIADEFAKKISNEYEKLDGKDIDIKSFKNFKPTPCIMPLDIGAKIRKMKNKTSTVPGDVPWKIRTLPLILAKMGHKVKKFWLFS
jgi:hypothetical protein